MEKLIAEMNHRCDEQPFFTAWYLRDLVSGETAHRNGDAVTRSASTRKISVMMKIMSEIHNGTVSLDERLLIPADSPFKHTTSGCFQHFTGEMSITVHDAMIMMIGVSDNTCTGTLIERLGGVEVMNEFCRKVGMNNTTHRLPIGGNKKDKNDDNETTASDVGHLLHLILAGSGGNEESLTTLGVDRSLCNLALDIMKWQRLNTRMPLMLPAYVAVAHKTGTTHHSSYNDAGIVFDKSNKPLFILVTYTDEDPQTLPDGTPGHYAASRLISSLTRMAYDHISDDPIKLF